MRLSQTLRPRSPDSTERSPDQDLLTEWSALFERAMAANGRPFQAIHNYARWMEEPGFVEINEKSFTLTHAAFSDEVWCMKFVESLSLRLLMQCLDWSEVRCESYLRRVAQAWCRMSQKNNLGA